MSIVVHVVVPDPDELLRDGQFGAGAIGRCQWSATTTQPGTFADLSGTGSDPTFAIVSGTNHYDLDDPSGDSTRFYRVRYENSTGSVAGAWSDSFQPGSLAWVTGPVLLAYMQGVSPADDAWAIACAASASAAVDNVLETDSNGPWTDAAMIAEVSSAALIIGAALWKRREAPNGLVPVTDLAGVAMRMAKDPVDGVRPMLNRWHPTAGLGIG